MPDQLFPLTGPIQKPATGGQPKQLVVLLHGLGSDGSDLIGLAPYFAELLPDAEFLAPDAPFPCDMAPYGWQWFSLQSRAPDIMAARIAAAAPILDAFLDEALAARGLDESKLALVGFSQGTMMALQVGLRRAKPAAGIVGFSGILVGAELLAEEIRSRPPTLLVHGDADEVVPVEALGMAVATLESVGVPVRQLLRPGLNHGIDEAGMAAAGDFLREILALE